MSSVINRGTKEKPALYASYKDADGKWQQKKIPAEHCHTEEDAHRWVEAKQNDITKHLPPGHSLEQSIAERIEALESENSSLRTHLERVTKERDAYRSAARVARGEA